MMRHAIFIMLASLLSCHGNLSAQERDDTRHDEWIRIRAERMAEQAAEEYGLDEKQTRILQEANQILLQKESERRDGRHHYDRRENFPGHHDRYHNRRDGHARHYDRNRKDICHDRYECCDRPGRHYREEGCCRY